MCTALTFRSKDNYFGRNLDFDFDFGQHIIITPRNFGFSFREHEASLKEHFAILGMGIIVDNYPLYFDGCNEHGLAMAGLYFSGNAVYRQAMKNKINIASFEIIPYILGQCSTIAEAKKHLKNINITNIAFNKDYAPAPLHWIISDKKQCIVVESTKDGLQVHDNKAEVLTNNPPFPMQMFNLNQYRHCSPKLPKNTFSKELNLVEYSRGMGGLGIPGDLSSPSRFVRIAFIRANATKESGSEESAVGQFLHILKSVEQQKGLCDIGGGKLEYTIYSSCCNMDKCIYYYTTYHNAQISAVSLFQEDLDCSKLISYPLVLQEQIAYINKK